MKALKILIIIGIISVIGTLIIGISVGCLSLQTKKYIGSTDKLSIGMQDNISPTLVWIAKGKGFFSAMELYLKFHCSSKLMGNLIDDLLEFSRVGRYEMKKSEINIYQLVNDVLKEFAEETNNRKIYWKIADLPKLYGDQSMIRLVFTNLISNAVKFTRNCKRPVIEIGCNDDGNEYIFFVKDNGVGFEMEYADKLFNVFQRLHRQDEFEGTGIGLASVRRIINRHGGKTWAEGKVNKGATFYFSLPKN